MSRLVPVLSFAVLMGGCAVSARGVVRPDATGPSMVTLEGRTVSLRVGEGRTRLIEYLDGEEIAVEGRRFLGPIRVQEWTLKEGTHGLQAFVGTLEQRSRGVGVLDHGSQAFYTIDEGATDDLIGALGKPVLLEGYVEGAQAVRVVYYRVLAD